MSDEQRIADRIEALKKDFKSRLDRCRKKKQYEEVETTLQFFEPRILEIIQLAKLIGIDLNESDLMMEFVFFFCSGPAWGPGNVSRANVLFLYTWAIDLCKKNDMENMAWILYDSYKLDTKSLLIPHLPDNLQSAARITL